MQRFLILLMVVGFGAACGSSPSGSTASGAVSTAEPAALTSTAEGARIPEPGEAWGLLWLADRVDPISDTVADLYIERAEAALGVDVEVLNEVSLYPVVRDVLQRIREERFPGMANLVRDAEIIVVQTWPRGAIEEEESGLCRYPSAANPVPDPTVLTPEYWSEYRGVLGEIYAEIWTLREGIPTVLIGIDYYNPFASEQEAAGIAAECRVFQDAWSVAQREVAEANGAFWVSFYDLLHGPDHGLDPLVLGYIGPTEQMPSIPYFVPNEVGSAMLAEALASVGFEPVEMP